MTKKIRDYLFWAFIAIFVVSTVLMSLYASGYKFNLSWPLKFNRLLVKTGMLVLSTKPDGAVVWLDSKPQTGAALIAWGKKPLMTPVKIKNLLPGKYELALQRDGYQPFYKQIDISSGQTTFLEDINLFRADEPARLLTSAAGEIILSPSRRYLYAAASQKIFDLKTGNENELAGAGTATGAWLDNSDRLLAGGILFTAGSGEKKNYGEILGTGIDSWSYDEGNKRLFFKNKGALSYLNTDKNTSTAITGAGDCVAYEPRGDNLFFVARSAGTISLYAYSLKTGEIWRQAGLPGVGDYHFASHGNQALELYDAKNSTLYLFDAGDISATPRIFHNVLDWQWLDDNTLLYNNAWEIYRADNQSSPILLTRVGEEISGLVWNSNKEYLVFATTGGLNALDLKTATITSLLRTEKAAYPILDTKSNTLYFWARIGGQEGIYRLLLQ